MGIAFSSSGSNANANTPRRAIAHPPTYPPPPPYNPLDYYSYYTPSPQPPPLYYPSFYGSNGYSVCNNEIVGAGGGGGGGGGVVGHPCFGNLVVGQPRMTADDQMMAKVVNSDVNVHKDSLRLEADELNPDRYLVSFVFDALLDGSITICYFAKEDSNRRVVPLFPDTYVPIKVPFRKGLRQEFRQPPGTGMDFSYFPSEALSSSSSREDVFPIVISADTFSPYMYHHHESRSYQFMAHSIPQTQITQVVIAVTSNNEEQLQYTAKAMRQLLWVDDTCYELKEIYGLGKLGSGKECVICMSEPKDIAVLPCRHMCMCSECAKALRVQSNKCPICREIIEALLEIKIEGMGQ